MLSRVACFSIPEAEFARSRLRLLGDIERFSAKHLDQVVTALRRVASDGAIFPLRLAPGSVVVELASSRAAQDRLWNMHQSGDLERLLGRPVVEMVRLPADAKELAPRLDGDPVAERFELVHLSGVTNHFARNRPSDFEFLFDNARGSDSVQEMLTAIGYFFEILSVPADDLWVNLGPAETDPVMPPSLRELEIGRVLLDADLLLKKLTASLLHPDSPSGRLYWATLQDELRLRDRAAPGGFELSFRLWMRPDKFVTENHGATILVKQARLAIQGEGTHGSRLSLTGADGPAQPQEGKVAWAVFQDRVLPLLQRELNCGRRFAPLRQLCFSFALAHAFRAQFDRRRASWRMDHWRRPGDPAGKPLSIVVAEANQHTQDEYRRLFDQGVFYVVRREPMMGTREMAVRSYFSGAADLRS